VAYALNRLAINIGMSIGPVAAGFLSLIDYSIIFYVDGITSIIAGFFLIYAPWTKSNTRSSSTDIYDEETQINIDADSNRKLIYFLIAMIPVSMVFFQHISTMPLFVVNELGISTATYGLLFAINTGMVILFEVPLNDYLGKFKEGRVLAVGAFLTGLGFGGMAFCTDVISIAVTIVIWTIGEMIILPISVAYVSNIAPDNKRGAYMGFYQMIFNLAFTVGPILGTIVMETHGSKILWYAIFILGLISTLMMLKLDKTKINSVI
jgi:MFS family permease